MEHLSLKDSAYKIIKNKILTAKFAAGERIREDVLAEEISISRTPVREAIHRLSAEGLVRNVPRKGIYPIELSSTQILDLLDIRESLETLAVIRCIEKTTPEVVRKLEEILTEFEAMIAREEFDKCNELDSRFHQEIARVSANEKLIEFLSEIEDFMRIARAFEKKTFPANKNRITLREHTKIFECVINKDKEGAVVAVRDNINRMKINMGI